jgi:uncharacterized protein (DUF302 family)
VINTTTTSSRVFEVEHIRIESPKSVEDVRLALETIVPQLDPAVAEVLRKGDEERAERERQHGPKLSVFVTRDHGSLLAIYRGARKAYQYEIGNQITAASMTRYHLRASLYAPLRVVLYEDDRGRAVFEYDKPSSLFGQFGDERVTGIALELDDTLKDVLERAAG